MPDSDFISEHEAPVITAKSPKLLKWFTSYSQRSDERKADFRESIFTVERRLSGRLQKQQVIGTEGGVLDQSKNPLDLESEGEMDHSSIETNFQV